MDSLFFMIVAFVDSDHEDMNGVDTGGHNNTGQ